MGAIAAEAGVTKKTLYDRFRCAFARACTDLPRLVMAADRPHHSHPAPLGTRLLPSAQRQD
ncbi:hypothetical protein [Streptomyces sp. NPDC047097]|uniref:hypothetical protein n=1 Tax=Streptomyces sp. NPDC047097 TaxID=3155260 RepID=UPI0033D4B7D7